MWGRLVTVTLQRSLDMSLSQCVFHVAETLSQQRPFLTIFLAPLLLRMFRLGGECGRQPKFRLGSTPVTQ